MLNYIKNLFKRDEDPSRTAMMKAFKGSYKGLDDMQQAVLMLRLSGTSRAATAIALDMSIAKLDATEKAILERLKK